MAPTILRLEGSCGRLQVMSGLLPAPSSVPIKAQEKGGAQGRNRTTDTAIFSRMLYQLSYPGVSREARPDASGRFIERLCPNVQRWRPVF